MSDLKEIEEGLWGSEPSPETYGMDLYHNHLLEQYKICVSMADNISQRRGATNTFFLTFNTALVGALAALFEDVPPGAALAFYVAAILLCVAWGLILRSYRSLNTAKYRVIGLMEKRLPSSPFWAAEWKALDEGRSLKVHIPLSPIETIVPIVFFFLYVYLAYLNLLQSVAVPETG